MSKSNLLLALEGNLLTHINAELDAIERGAMDAAYRMALRGKKALRNDVVRGGLGNRLAKAWHAKVYPVRALSMTPTVRLYTKAPLLVRAFDEGATIRSSKGFWLAIPTEDFTRNISGRGLSRNRKNLIRLAEQRFGRLRFVAVKGKRLGLLVTDSAQKSRGKRGGYRPASEATKRKGRAESIVLFVLVPQAKLRKRLHYSAIARGLERDWPGYFARGVAKSLAQEAA